MGSTRRRCHSADSSACSRIYPRHHRRRIASRGIFFDFSGCRRHACRTGESQDLRPYAGHLRHAAGVLVGAARLRLSYQVVRIARHPRRRHCLWTVCKPQPLRRVDGDAGAVCPGAGFSQKPIPARAHSVGSRWAAHGSFDLSFRIARRHGGIRGGICGLCHYSHSATQQKSRRHHPRRRPGFFYYLHFLDGRRRAGSTSGDISPSRRLHPHPLSDRPRYAPDVALPSLAGFRFGQLHPRLSPVPQLLHR